MILCMLSRGNNIQTNNGYNVGLNANTNPVSKNMGLNYAYQNNYLALNTYGSYNSNADTDNFAQYGGSFDTRIAYAPDLLGIGGGSLGSNTGIIVEVITPNKNSPFDVYVNKRLIKKINSNQSVFIMLPPYETYHVKVVDASNYSYHLDASEKTVTLYPGNAQSLKWTASREIVLIGQLIDQQGKPMANTKLDGNEGFNYTDNEGFFEVTINTDVKKIEVEKDQGVCHVNVPKVNLNKNYLYLTKVECLPKIESELDFIYHLLLQFFIII